MTLGELIKLLESMDPETVIENGFDHPHSWRGIYSELAFEPARHRTVAQMLDDARSALGAIYEGYKGGEYTMDEHTEVHIAIEGTSHDYLPEYGVKWMLGK